MNLYIFQWFPLKQNISNLSDFYLFQIIIIIFLLTNNQHQKSMYLQANLHVFTLPVTIHKIEFAKKRTKSIKVVYMTHARTVLQVIQWLFQKKWLIITLHWKSWHPSLTLILIVWKGASGHSINVCLCVSQKKWTHAGLDNMKVNVIFVWTIPLIMLGRCKAYCCPGCLFSSLCVVLCICHALFLQLLSNSWASVFSPQAQCTQLKELLCPDDKMYHNETM